MKKKKASFIIYTSLVFIISVRPPTPPSPGPLIVKEIREPQAAAAPPLVIRTRAPREKTPPPIIIREAPPQMPHVDTNPQYVTRVVRQTESSYSSPPQKQQQQQQYQHFESFGNGTVNYDQFNGLQTGNPYGNGINQFGNQQEPAWVTEVVSDNGATSAAPPHLLDHIYRAINNQLPRV
jgi:hypothetical protein